MCHGAVECVTVLWWSVSWCFGVCHGAVVECVVVESVVVESVAVESVVVESVVVECRGGVFRGVHRGEVCRGGVEKCVMLVWWSVSWWRIEVCIMVVMWEVC